MVTFGASLWTWIWWIAFDVWKDVGFLDRWSMSISMSFLPVAANRLLRRRRQASASGMVLNLVTSLLVAEAGSLAFTDQSRSVLSYPPVKNCIVWWIDECVVRQLTAVFPGLLGAKSVLWWGVIPGRSVKDGGWSYNIAQDFNKNDHQIVTSERRSTDIWTGPSP
jgi:hypothetical protein